MPKIQVEKQHTLHGHRDCVYALTEAEDIHCFYSAGGDGLVVRWDLRNTEQGRVVAKVPTSIYAMHYSEESNLLVVGQNYEGIHVIDLNNDHERGSLKLGKAAIFAIVTQDNYLWIATSEGNVLIIDRDTLTIKHQIRPTRERARSLALNSEAQEIAVGFSDHTVRIFDTTTYQLKHTISGHTNSVFTATYSPNGQYLISGGRDAHLKVWDVRKNYQLTESIVAHMYAINHIDFSDDGQLFATGSMDKSIKIWDACQFRLLKVIDKARHAGHGTSVNRVLWLPSSVTGERRGIVSASDDRTISIWNLQESSLE